MLLQDLINAVVQVLLFSVIPLLWWFFTVRKKVSLWDWLGVKKPVIKSLRSVLILSVVFVAISVIVNYFLTGMMRSETATEQFQNTGASSILSGILYGMITTGLSEEILFRGFVAKRLIKLLGFGVGNTVQAVLFGLVHVGLFCMAARITVLEALLVFVVPAIGGWVFGYINEKQAGGSIVPSWMLHGVGNVIASVMMMFGLFRT